MSQLAQEYADARRESILDAAARLFARKGLSRATMAEIAADADLTAGAIYRYFGSKDELFRAVFDDAETRYRQMFYEATRSTSSPFEALARIGRRFWIDFDDRDDLICQIQMALAAARDPDDFGVDLSQSRQVIRQLLKGIIRAAQDADEIDPDVDPASLALLLQAATGGIQMLKLEEGEDIDTEAAFNLLVHMVRGLRAGAPDMHER